MLALHHLDSGYKPLQILWDIELFLEKGEWLAILGSNGAGKSTLLKTVAGLLKPFQGEIWYESKEISSVPVYERVKLGIALVPEGRRLFTGMTVRENLMMGAYQQNGNSRNTEQLEKVFDLFPHLKGREKQVVGTLSGGEQQMCAIGRALMSRPKLLLIDELSLGLAPVVIKRIYEAMGHLVQKGTTILVVEQDVQHVLTVADYVACFLEGRISLEGKPSDLSSEQITAAYFGM